MSWASHVPKDKTYPLHGGSHRVVETKTQKQMFFGLVCSVIQ